ncbi:hypothetical protein MCEMSEM23_01394 [Rhabdaerophilaceae bacterium]
MKNFVTLGTDFVTVTPYLHVTSPFGSNWVRKRRME